RLCLLRCSQFFLIYSLLLLFFFFFFFTYTSPLDFYTLSLHDALPILLSKVMMLFYETRPFVKNYNLISSFGLGQWPSLNHFYTMSKHMRKHCSLLLNRV